jgi:uncharacterized coiled-coil DUF342 family protein
MAESPELATQIEMLAEEIQQGKIVDKRSNHQTIQENSEGYQNIGSDYGDKIKMTGDNSYNVKEQHHHYYPKSDN